MKSRPVLTSIVWLALITWLALGLRLYRLDAQSLWYDEGFSVYLARMGVAELTARTAADIQPPLYYYLLHGWIGLFGDGEAAVRGLSVLWGVLSIPLVYALAWQLFHSRLAGLLAALLMAVSPPQVWYSQEARMYTLLTFLCLLSSYFLLLVVRRLQRMAGAAEPDSGVVTGTLWLAFTLSNVAALYTHYFAAFVLAFQGLYLLGVWLRRGCRPARLLLGGLASAAATALAYLPWLPPLITRYGADMSYLPGRLKVAEALLDIALFFAGGESVPEQTGLPLALGYLLVLLLCLVQGTGTNLRRGRWGYSKQKNRGCAPHRRGSQTPAERWDAPLSFLLLYLVLPPALILALAYHSPKFNARYVLLSHPALLLLLAGGLAVLWQRRRSYLGNLARWTMAGLSLLFLLGASAYADYQACTDPAVARADFRGVAHYLRKQIGPDETVILCSGHLFPIFDYYAPGLERHLLPDSPTLDVTRTLDYSIAGELNRWLAGRGGVWLVLWQDEVVDPVGYLTAMLAEVGQEQPVRRTFVGVRLRHYRLPADARFAAQPTIAHPTSLNFGNRLRLLGYTQSGSQQVTLFWQAIQPLDQDYRVSLTLRDTVGQVWGRWDGRPTAYLYPTSRWRVGQIVPGRYDLIPMPGTPPGDYGLEVGVYTEAEPSGLDLLDEAGAAQGRRAMLGAVRLSVPAVTADQVEVPHPLHADLGGGLLLLGWDLDRVEAQPGDRLLLTLVWGVASRPPGDYQVLISLADAAGQRVEIGPFPPTNLWHPTSVWLAGQAWRGQASFRLPIQVQPGQAHLEVQLVEPGGGALGPAVELTAIQVQPTSHLFTPPHPQVPRPANFGDQIALLGADLPAGPTTPGSTLPVTLYWQGQAEMDVPYTVFVHLLGPDGRVVAGQDGEPAAGTRPTSGWVPGEYITDLHQVPLPADLPPGEYVIEVGLYDAGAPGLPRLPLLDDEGKVAADRVIFGPVAVR